MLATFPKSAFARRRTIVRSPSRVAASKGITIHHGVDHSSLSVDVYPTEADVAASLCKMVESESARAIADHGYFALAVPGGSVLKALAGLRQCKVDWARTYLFFVNHKCLPMTDDKATYKKARPLCLG